MRELVIDGARIADDTDCYVIAEIGHNHGGDLDKCFDMIDAAITCGCSCVKLQKRDNKTLYAEEFYNSPYVNENSYGRTYGEHREALEFGKEEYLAFRDYCKEKGIGFSATAFDIPSAKFLADVGVDWLKLASGDLTNTPLLQECASLGLPIVFSTGGATSIKPVVEAYDILTSWGSDVAVLQCTSGYPAEWEELNLRTITQFREALPKAVVGWSMHARGISQAVAAYTLGARIIEAHFTLDRYAKGTDQRMSLEPDGMAAMVRYLGYCQKALGDGIKRQYESEIEPLKKQRKNAEGRVDGRQAA